MKSKDWINRQKKDFYVKKAKKQGYLSRAAYKLLEIHNKFQILENSKKILEFGAAPGGWSQVALEINPRIEITAIDLLDLKINQINTPMFLTTRNEFKDYLSKNSIDYSEVRKKFVIEKTWNSLIYQIYNKQVVINEKEISSKLEKIVNQNTFQETFRLSEIIFPASNKSDFEKKYKKILQDIEVMGFDQAAIIHSISDTSNFGGEVGWVKESQLSKKIYDLIKDLKINQLTKPITTPGGVLILKINEIKNTPNDEVDKEVELSKIIKAEKNRQLNEYSVIHFRKIENRSYVKKI